MSKSRIYAALVAGIVGVAIHRYFKIETPTIPEAPPLSPELQKWADYVEKYPNLEDDPKIKHAIDVLEQDKKDHPE